MSFAEENIPAFLENFEIIKDKIRNAPGNRLLELYQDKSNKCIFFTYSYWEAEKDLENYRKSELFGTVWGSVKTLFSERSQAFSLEKYIVL